MAELRESGGQAAGPGLQGRAGDVVMSLRQQARGEARSSAGGEDGGLDEDAFAFQDGSEEEVPLGWAVEDVSRWDAEGERMHSGAAAVRVGSGAAGLASAARRLLTQARYRIATEAGRGAAGSVHGGAQAASSGTDDDQSHDAAEERQDRAATAAARSRALQLWAEEMRGAAVGAGAAAAQADDRARATRLASLAAVTVSPPSLVAVIRGEAGERAAPGSAEAAARAVDQLQPPPGSLRDAGAAASDSVLRAVARAPDGWWRMGAAGSEADVRKARLALPWRAEAGERAPGWPHSLPSKPFGGAEGGAEMEGESEGGEASDWWLAYLAGVGGTSAGTSVSRAVERARAEASAAGAATTAGAEGKDAGDGSSHHSAEQDRAMVAAVAQARALGVAPMLETLAAAQPPASIHRHHHGHGMEPAPDAAGAGEAGAKGMPVPPGRAQLSLWGLATPGQGETRHVASGMAPSAAEAARRGPRLPPAVVGAAMERLGVADPWSPGLHDAIARSAFRGPQARARFGQPAEEEGREGSASRQQARRTAAEAAEAAQAEANAAEAEAEAAAGEASKQAEQEAHSSAAILEALRDPDDPLSLASALRAAPAVGMPDLALPWAEAAVRMDERGEAGRRWTGDGLEVIKLATRMPASLGIAGRSMDERVMAAVAQMRRQREAGERADAARADARQLRKRMEAAARARAAAELEDARRDQPLTTPRRLTPPPDSRYTEDDGGGSDDGAPGAQGVALPASALQQVRGAGGEQLLVLTADQLRALAAAVGPAAGGGDRRGQQRRQGANPAHGSPDRRHRPRPAVENASSRGSPSRRITDGSSLDISRDTDLSEGALAVGVRVKQSFGAAATPSAPRGGAPASWMSPGPRPGSPLRSPARSGRQPGGLARPARERRSSQRVRDSMERPFSAAALGESGAQ